MYKTYTICVVRGEMCFFRPPPRREGWYYQKVTESKKEAKNSLSESWQIPREGWVYKRECRSEEKGGVLE